MTTTPPSWLARSQTPPPEKIVFWFGAGLSAASGMPLGLGLTRHWLAHHLPDGEDQTILGLFKKHAELFEKDLPRLEKVIEDAVWCFGPGCLANLEFFRACPPNAAHRAIADHLVRHRGWAITTNFDTAVEDCRPEIPVATPARDPVAGWGLIKLHGSIGEDLGTLGHSISNLQAGLTPRLRELVIGLLDDPSNCIVFCGYSGADFFDIVPLFQERERSETPFAARVIWLHHVVGVPGRTDLDRDWSDEDWEERLTSGALAMLRGFDDGRKEGRAGDTPALLAELIPVPELPSSQPEAPWWAGWDGRFRPDAAGRARYAAKLYASFGMGRRSAAFIDAGALATDRFTRDHQLYFNALRDQGFYRAERVLRRWAMRAPSPGYSSDFHRRQLAVTLRLSHYLISAAVLYGRLLIRAADAGRFAGADRFSLLWAVAEAGLFAQGILNRLPDPGVRRALLLPLEAGLRLMIGAALRIYQARAAGCPEASDPHLQATVTRISSFLADWPGTVLSAFEDWFYRPHGLPVLDGVHDDTPDRYRETDSLLGMINYWRNHANEAMIAARWERSRPTSGPEARTDGETFDWRDWLDEAVQSLKKSYRIASAIDEPMGRIKALRLMARIAGLCGQRRLAAGRSRLAAKLEREHAGRQRAALDHAKAWVRARPLATCAGSVPCFRQ